MAYEVPKLLSLKRQVIAAIEAKIDKTRRIKSGMVQELTRKTRL